MTLSHVLVGYPPIQTHPHFFFLVAPSCSILLCRSAALLLCCSVGALWSLIPPAAQHPVGGALIFSQWCLADNSVKLNWCSASSAKIVCKKKVSWFNTEFSDCHETNEYLFYYTGKHLNRSVCCEPKLLRSGAMFASRMQTSIYTQSSNLSAGNSIMRCGWFE